MVPPPGYGLSDLALIIRIASRIHDAYKNSPGEFQALSREVETLKSTVEEFARRFPNDERNGNRKSQPEELISEAKELLERLDERLDKYKSLATEKKLPFDRLLFGTGKTQKLRERMKTLTSFIRGFQIETILQQTNNISNQVAQIFDKVVRDKINDNTLGSMLWADFFNEIYLGLKKRDISMDEIKGNKSFIIESIVKGVENQNTSSPKSPAATQLNTVAKQDDQGSKELSGTTPLEHQSDYENIFRPLTYPWDALDLHAVESTLIASTDEEAELKASILQAVTKRISLREVGESSKAHDGLPLDPPSTFAKESSKLFESGAFRPAQSGPDVLSGIRKASTSSVGEAKLEAVTRMNTGSSSASRRTSQSFKQEAPKGFLGTFLPNIGHTSWASMEKTDEMTEPVSTPPPARKSSSFSTLDLDSDNRRSTKGD